MGKVVIGLLILSILGVAVTYVTLRNYLRSEGFRNLLSAQISRNTGVDGTFSPFRWEGLAVDSELYDAAGEGAMKSLRVSDIHTEIGLGGLSRGVWEIRDSRLRRLEVSMDLRTPTAPELPHLAEVQVPVAVETARPQRMKTPAWFPKKAELQELDVQELVANVQRDEGVISLSGMALQMERARGEGEGAYRMDLRGGSLRLPSKHLPELRLESAKLRNQAGRVFLTESKIKAWEKGQVVTSGELEISSGRFSLEGNLTGLKCDDLLNEDWSKRLTGNVSTTFIANNPSGAPQANGHLKIENGMLTALPVLDVLAAYTDIRRFRVLPLSAANTDWTWKKGEFSLQNLVLASEGLVRLEGMLVIRDGALDGNFRLGIAPGILSKIPGAEEDVFHLGAGGLLWTPLRITGTVDKMKEDLTGRLMAAAGLRIFEQLPSSGENVMKFTRSLIQDSSPEAIEKSTKIIEEGSKTIREVSGILDGILGGRKDK